MLSQAQRTTILELHAQGVSRSEIARVLNISRLTVRKILRSNSTQVPALLRPEKAEPHRQQILELLSACKGNLVRVQEDLAASGVNLSYSTLTAFCRRHGIGQPPAVAVGRYEFLPGEEMQHSGVTRAGLGSARSQVGREVRGPDLAVLIDQAIAPHERALLDVHLDSPAGSQLEQRLPKLLFPHEVF